MIYWIKDDRSTSLCFTHVLIYVLVLVSSLLSLAVFTLTAFVLFGIFPNSSFWMYCWMLSNYILLVWPLKKIAFKVIQMKFLAMHITNQKLSFDIYGRTFTKYNHGTWSLLNILMIFGIKEKCIHTMYFWLLLQIYPSDLVLWSRVTFVVYIYIKYLLFFIIVNLSGF